MRLISVLALLWAGSVHAETVVRDCPDCPAMVTLPAGIFQMGSAVSGAGPEHTVIVPSFAIGKYEVTQKEWRALMGNNPSHFANCGDNCPVETISWNDAQAFIKRLNKTTGKTYRLPTEAEWEYACRAGGTGKYCGGDDAGAVAWYGDKAGGPHPVGRKKPNAFGLFDMSGNVAEWTEDCYHKDYTGAPTDGSAWEDSGDCNFGMMRGGGWNGTSDEILAAIRQGVRATSLFSNVGLRLAKTLY